MQRRAEGSKVPPSSGDAHIGSRIRGNNGCHHIATSGHLQDGGVQASSAAAGAARRACKDGRQQGWDVSSHMPLPTQTFACTFPAMVPAASPDAPVQPVRSQLSVGDV